MGIFNVDCEVENIRTGRSAAVGKLLVDTGAEFTWLPQEALRGLGVEVAKEDQQFVMANGQLVTRSTGYVIIRAVGFETVDEVVFAEPEDLTLMGARTLEGFGATVDPRRRRLVAAGPHPAAIADTFSMPVPPSPGAKETGHRISLATCGRRC